MGDKEKKVSKHDEVFKVDKSFNELIKKSVEGNPVPNKYQSINEDITIVGKEIDVPAFAKYVVLTEILLSKMPPNEEPFCVVVSKTEGKGYTTVNLSAKFHSIPFPNFGKIEGDKIDVSGHKTITISLTHYTGRLTYHFE